MKSKLQIVIENGVVMSIFSPDINDDYEITVINENDPEKETNAEVTFIDPEDAPIRVMAVKTKVKPTIIDTVTWDEEIEGVNQEGE